MRTILNKLFGWLFRRAAKSAQPVGWTFKEVVYDGIVAGMHQYTARYVRGSEARNAIHRFHTPKALDRLIPYLTDYAKLVGRPSK